MKLWSNLLKTPHQTHYAWWVAASFPAWHKHLCQERMLVVSVDAFVHVTWVFVKPSATQEVLTSRVGFFIIKSIHNIVNSVATVTKYFVSNSLQCAFFYNYQRCWTSCAVYTHLYPNSRIGLTLILLQSLSPNSWVNCVGQFVGIIMVIWENSYWISLNFSRFLGHKLSVFAAVFDVFSKNVTFFIQTF